MLAGITSLEEDSLEFGSGIGTPKKGSLSKFDEGVSVESTGFGAATTGTKESTQGGGLKYSSNIGRNKISQSFFVGGIYSVGEGGFGTSLEQNVLGVKS
ncbi:hypothetical protein Tco_0314958 [Tanacetum coccineum]